MLLGTLYDETTVRKWLWFSFGGFHPITAELSSWQRVCMPEAVLTRADREQEKQAELEASNAGP